MIKTIIFDNNGVLVYSDSEKAIPAFAEFFDTSPEYLESFFHKEAEAFDDGRITAEEFYCNLADKLGKDFDAEELRDLNINCYASKPGMQDLVRNLKNDFEVALLTNLGDIYDEANSRLWDYDNLFGPENQFVSYKLKMKKPEKEIYKYVLRHLGKSPTECVFTDDREANLLPAKELGIRTILFRSPEQFKNELKLLIEKENGKS